jgi:hypothetical protein
MASGRPFSMGAAPFSAVGMATTSDSREETKKAHRDLRIALQQCRELLAKTQELLERAHRVGGPTGT